MCVLERKIKFYFPCLYTELSGSVILSRCFNTFYPSPLTPYWITSLGLFRVGGRAEIPTGEKAITNESLIILPILLVQGGQFILDTLLTKSSHKLYSTPQADSGFIKQKVAFSVWQKHFYEARSY